MIIDDFRVDASDGLTWMFATVHWEDRDRDPVEIFYAVEDSNAWRVGPNPDAFRIPAAVVARHDQEKRITGGGPMCPALHDGLANALTWLARWSKSDSENPVIDLPLACAHPTTQGGGQSAAFVSGGVDSSALLAYNHSAYEKKHPRRISLGIVVIGIQMNRWTGPQDLASQIKAAKDDLSLVGASTGIDVVPVATNVRDLNRGGSFWKYEYQGAALSGIGHLFSSSISDLSIASTWEIRYLDNWGSHPVLDSGYGTHSLRVWHELAHLGRLEKTRLVATQTDLVKALNVCNRQEKRDRNCGKCEKCVRTMLALESLGELTGASAFEKARVEPSDLRNVRILDRGLEGEYEELIQPLARAGRPELASAVRRAIRRGRVLRMRGIRGARILGSRLVPRSTRERLYGSTRSS